MPLRELWKQKGTKIFLERVLTARTNFLDSNVLVVKFKFPFAIERLPRGPHEIRARVLRPGNRRTIRQTVPGVPMSIHRNNGVKRPFKV